MNAIKLATVFSGIGAIEWAFKRLNYPFDIVFACDNGERDVDIDVEKARQDIANLQTEPEITNYIRDLYSKQTRKINYVEKTYLLNYGDKIGKDRFYDDVRLLDGNRYKGQVDLLMGGSPCQSFSAIGKQLGFQDTRGTLFYEFARLIKEISPKVFVYENVKGLRTHDKGKTFDTIIHVLKEEFDYDVTFHVFNATDFNIPQKRNRILIVGTKKKKCFDVAKIKTESLTRTMQQFLEDNCAFNNFLSDGQGGLVIKQVPGEPSPKAILTPAVTRYVLKSGTKTWYMKPEMDKPIARTLLKTMDNHHRAGVDNYVTINADKKIYRALTPRECLRLMGFTDDFKVDDIPWGHLYMEAGNSIVVDMLISMVKGLVDSKAFEEG